MTEPFDKIAEKRFNDVKEFLSFMILDFMFIVGTKYDDETDAGHEKRVNEAFKKYDAKWRLKCVEPEYEFLIGREAAFSQSIQLIAADGAKGQVAGVNLPLRRISKKQEAQIIKLIKS